VSRDELQRWLAAIETEINDATRTSVVSLPRVNSLESLSSYVQRVNDSSASVSSATDSASSNYDNDGDDQSAQELHDAEDNKEKEKEDSDGDNHHHQVLAPSTLSVPPMNIVILVVGTRGDAHPFTALGNKLQERGHRVRLATHAMYRETVTNAGLEFYPLAGDPILLSAHMVKTHGRLIPDVTDRSELAQVSENMVMINEILLSTWPACTEPDPETPDKQFVADAIISNPVTCEF
jgi:hypothetical protein